MTKAELRQKLKQVRLEMTEASRTVKSRAIVENLKKAQDWSQVKSLHYFEPMAELMEPDISGLVTWLEDNYSVQLFTPRKIEGQWEMVSIKSEPAPEQFDVVLVPMLGFDSNLHRIGYGGGFYDKFLSSQPNARKVGVCFNDGKVEQIPAEPHDIPLDLVVTEAGNTTRF